MTGEVLYNGFKFNEFVPQKTSAYISQHDLHIAEMTVRETLDFSARCQGTGSRTGKFFSDSMLRILLFIKKGIELDTGFYLKI